MLNFRLAAFIILSTAIFLVPTTTNAGSECLGSVTNTCTVSDLTPACRNNLQCSNPSDTTVIQGIRDRCGGGYCPSESNELLDRLKKDGKLAASSCTFYDFEFNTCVWYPLASTIGSLLMGLGITVVTLAGVLFEKTITILIVQFGHYLAFIKPGIDAGWTALRDIANIIIIGLFVFIAINMILGVKEFGEKKAVAKILIVAVLINFSLLFTKVIVDASNFTAYQFYNSMIKGVEAQSISIGGAELTSTKNAISGSFMRFMGVKGIADARDKLQKVAESSESGFLAILYGLLSLILLLAVAIVFAYGSFLILSRAVLIIFLMLTSALAFASWLIPNQFISEGFQKWWKSLLKSAFFAPILVAFLWMTLKVSDALSSALQGPMGAGTLGKLAENASSEQNIVALMNFALVLGLLYASIATANMFSKTISGFRFATVLSALPITAGSRFLAAPLLRQTAGWVGSAYERSRLGQARGLRDQGASWRRAEAMALEKGQTKRAAGFGAIAQRLEARADTKLKRAARGAAVAESKMNVMDSDLMQRAAKAAGAGFAGASGRGTKSYADQIKARTDAAEKEAAKIAPTGEQNDRARKQVEDQRTLGLKQLQAAQNAERNNAEAVKQFEQLGQKLIATQQSARSEEDAASNNKMVIEQTFRASAGTAADIARRNADMNFEDQRIARARGAVQTIQQRIDVLDKPVKDAAKAIEEYQKQTENIGKQVVAAMGESAENIAERVGRRSGDVLERTLGKLTGANEVVAQGTKGLYKNRRRTANLREVISSMQAETAPAAPPRPTPGATP